MSFSTWERPKDPDEILDYGIDWTKDIGSATIVTSAWVVVDGDVVVDASNHTDKTATARLSGGTAGSVCLLNNHLVLSNGEQPELSVKLKIKAR